MAAHPTPPLPSDLQRLAERSGVLTTYEGTDGAVQHASEDAVRAVLTALGTSVASKKEIRAALKAKTAERARRIVEPMLVSWTDRPASVPVALHDTEPEQGWVSLEMEDGGVVRKRLTDTLTGGAKGRGGGIDLGRFGPMEPGYHALVIEAPQLAARARLLVAPPCPIPQRGWGAFMPLHALRTEDDWGIGSYSSLAAVARWVAELGADFLGTLPLYPVSDTAPIDPSPYLPLSRLAYNELFIDVTAVPELSTSPEARAVLHSGDLARRLADLRAQALVDYEGVAPLKRRLLELMCAQLGEGSSARLRALVAFGQQHPELVAYASYRGRGEGAAAKESDIRYHLYTQWIASEQLSAAATTGCSLYGDLPVGVRPDGFDPEWAADSFASGVHGGAPPDAFFEGGQNWGFRPLHPEHMRQDGYRYQIECLRRACRHADVLRIDHAAGLDRLYWIPEGMDADNGVFVRYHSAELRALVCIEAQRSETVIVGEDLGTVPDEVRTAMTHDKMLRSWVMQFESTADDPFPEPPAQALASWATHDLPRFTAYFEDSVPGRQAWRTALQARIDGAASPTAAEPDADAALGAVVAHIALSDAELMLVDLEELWGAVEPQNHPGTGPEANNWRRRAAVSLHEMQADSRRVRLLTSLEPLRRRTRAENPLQDAAAS